MKRFKNLNKIQLIFNIPYASNRFLPTFKWTHVKLDKFWIFQEDCCVKIEIVSRVENHLQDFERNFWEWLDKLKIYWVQQKIYLSTNLQYTKPLINAYNAIFGSLKKILLIKLCVKYFIQNQVKFALV